MRGEHNCENKYEWRCVLILVRVLGYWHEKASFIIIVIRHDIYQREHSHFIGSHCNCYWFQHTPQGRRELQLCICMYVCVYACKCVFVF